MVDDPREPKDDLVDEENDGQEDGDEGQGEDARGSPGDEEGQGRPEQDGEEERVEADFSTGRPIGRREREVLRAKEDARTAREAADRATRELNDYRRQMEESRRREDPAIEEARVALMNPDQKLDYWRNKDRQEADRKFQALQLQVVDSSDRAVFNSKYSANPVFSKYSDRVEAALREVRARGGNTDRETVLKYLVGEDAMSKVGKAKTEQTNRGRENIQRQTTRPGTGRSDQVGTQRRGGLSEREQRAKRLEGVNLLDI